MHAAPVDSSVAQNVHVVQTATNVATMVVVVEEQKNAVGTIAVLTR